MYKVRVIEDINEECFEVYGKKHLFGKWRHLLRIRFGGPYHDEKEEARVKAINKAMDYKNNEVVFEA